MSKPLPLRARTSRSFQARFEILEDRAVPSGTLAQIPSLLSDRAPDSAVALIVPTSSGGLSDGGILSSNLFGTPAAPATDIQSPTQDASATSPQLAPALSANWLDSPSMETLTSENTPPTALGFANISVNEDSEDQLFDVFGCFHDQEDPDIFLSYSLVSNTNPALFTYVGPDGDGSNGMGRLSFAPNANGNAVLTIRATDQGGLWADATLNVHVEPVNDAPQMTLDATPSLGTWHFDGRVGDIDDSVVGWTVTGRILEYPEHTLSATVGSDGWYHAIVDEDEMPKGYLTVIVTVTDPHGATATASDPIYVM